MLCPHKRKLKISNRDWRLTSCLKVKVGYTSVIEYLAWSIKFNSIVDVDRLNVNRKSSFDYLYLSLPDFGLPWPQLRQNKWSIDQNTPIIYDTFYAAKYVSFQAGVPCDYNSQVFLSFIVFWSYMHNRQTIILLEASADGFHGFHGNILKIHGWVKSKKF